VSYHQKSKRVWLGWGVCWICKEFNRLHTLGQNNFCLECWGDVRMERAMRRAERHHEIQPHEPRHPFHLTEEELYRQLEMFPKDPAA